MKDLIVEEVRKVREMHAKKFNYDLHAICMDLRRKEKDYNRRLVSLSHNSALRAAV